MIETIVTAALVAGHLSFIIPNGLKETCPTYQFYTTHYGLLRLWCEYKPPLFNVEMEDVEILKADKYKTFVVYPNNSWAVELPEYQTAPNERQTLVCKSYPSDNYTHCHWRNKKMSKLGAFIKRFRERGELTQLELAKKLGCNTQQIYIWETGRAIVPVKHAPKLAAALDIPEAELIEYIVKLNTEKLLTKLSKRKTRT